MVLSGSGVSRSEQQFQNAFRLAVDSVSSHKLRSFLTLLGVIIGVASVIMVGAAIAGLGVYARFVESLNGDRVLYSSYRDHSSDIKHENLTCEAASILGASADLAGIRDIGVVDGRFFTQQEDGSRALVAAIGETVQTTLFPGEASPLHEESTTAFRDQLFPIVAFGGVRGSLNSAAGALRKPIANNQQLIASSQSVTSIQLLNPS